eukprot:4183477-Prymnesium_polylepis.1
MPVDVPPGAFGTAEVPPEEGDLDSALIWAIRYLECDAVEEMLSEGEPSPPSHAHASLERASTAQPQHSIAAAAGPSKPGGCGLGRR